MRNSIVLVGVVLGLAACSQGGKVSSDGTGLPAFKAGAWETSDTSLGFVRVAQTCLADPMESERENLSPQAGEGCKVERSEIPGGFRHVQRCEGFGLKSVVEAEFTGNGEAFEFKTRTVMNDSQPLEISRKARLVGPCPAGVSDGDLIGEEKMDLAPTR